MRRPCAILALLVAGVPAQEARADLPTSPQILWHAAGDPAYPSRAPAVLGQRVFAAGEHLVALDLRSGKEMSRARTPGPWQPAILGGGLVFARHDDGSVHAFPPTLDRELWSVPLDPGAFPGATCGDVFLVASDQELVAITGGQILWRMDLGATIPMTPATDGKRAFAATAAGRVVAIDVGSGDLLWERDLEAEAGHSNPVVDGDTLFLADRGQRDGRHGALSALAVADGHIRWQTVFGATGFATPFPHGDRVWGGFGTTVIAFDRATGAMDRGSAIRTGRNPFGAPRVVGATVAFGNLDGSFYVHDLATKALRWRFEVGGQGQVGGWTVRDGILLLSTTNGLFAIAQTKDAAPVAPGFVLRPASK